MKTYYTMTNKGIANLNIYKHPTGEYWTVKLQYGFKDHEPLYPPIKARSYAALVAKLNKMPGFFVRKGGTRIRSEREMLTTLIKKSKIFIATY